MHNISLTWNPSSSKEINGSLFQPRESSSVRRWRLRGGAWEDEADIAMTMPIPRGMVFIHQWQIVFDKNADDIF